MGLDVHRGARIAALAHGEQVLVSATTAALLDSKPLRDVGQHRLKDFEGAVRLYQLGESQFPPLRTLGSVELPSPATRFLGREQELFDAVSLLYERDPRVLTILGPGGTGKTRFAIELARLLADEADGGTVFVPLAPLRDPQLVLPAIADRLGSADPDPRAIAARLGERRTHVVWDNVEHLLPDAALTLGELAASAPTLRLLVTSREALHVQGEHELDLPPPQRRKRSRSSASALRPCAPKWRRPRLFIASANDSIGSPSRSSSRRRGRSCSRPKRSSNGSVGGFVREHGRTKSAKSVPRYARERRRPVGHASATSPNPRRFGS